MGWTDTDAPFYPTPYDWRLPGAGEQHQSETQAPGDLAIRPADLTLTPGEIQWPAEREWELSVDPVDDWYIWGAIE